ncbi:MAG: peptide MFS transporter [Pseudomonadota bacterium]
MKVTNHRQVLGHPAGIFLIFSTEIWERFSYYGMRGLLVLFLSSATLEGGFGWTAGRALEVYAAYTAIVYIAPIIGGYIADRWLGRRRAVILGSMLMMAGHFTMVIPGIAPALVEWSTGYPVYAVLHESGIVLGEMSISPAAVTAMADYSLAQGWGPLNEGAVTATYLAMAWAFFLALFLIIAGSGFFKPNMAIMVGELYVITDPRRDAGYTVYYMGANIGAFAANLVAGTIGEVYGWHYGFSVAGLGMAIGLATFLYYSPKLMEGIGERPVYQRAQRPPLTPDERLRVLGILLMSMFTIVFWMGFEQGGGLLNLVVRDSVDREIVGFEVPVTWFQSLNPMFIFLFAPLFVALWGLLARRGIDLHPTRKYAISLSLMAASFGLLTLAYAEIERTGSCSAWWLVGVFAVQTAAELAISPVSKALVSRYAPKQIASPLMGAEFLCYAIGAWLAGQVGAWALDTDPSKAFIFLLLASLATAALCLLLRPVVDRLLEGRAVAWPLRFK